ncbi:MAG: hypothetical protein WDO13_16270 [Verrucomicrobiota bacterium]
MRINEIEAEALRLGPEEQARLLHRLALALDSFEEPELTNDELERRWRNFESSGQAVESSVLHERARQRYGH